MFVARRGIASSMSAFSSTNRVLLSRSSGPGSKLREIMVPACSTTTRQIGGTQAPPPRAAAVGTAAENAEKLPSYFGQTHRTLALAAAAVVAVAAAATTAYVTADELATAEDEPMELLSSLMEVVGADRVSTEDEMYVTTLGGSRGHAVYFVGFWLCPTS